MHLFKLKASFVFGSVLHQCRLANSQPNSSASSSDSPSATPLAPQSYLSADPSTYLEVVFGPQQAVKCKPFNNYYSPTEDKCIAGMIIPGACYNLQGGLYHNLGSLTWSGQFRCRVYSDSNCYGISWDYKNGNIGEQISASLGEKSSSFKCGHPDDLWQDYSIVLGSIQLCTHVSYGAPCTTLHPRLNQCYNLEGKISGEASSARVSFGMTCTLFSDYGCSGDVAPLLRDYPKSGVYDLGLVPDGNGGTIAFNDKAMSFHCTGAI